MNIPKVILTMSIALILCFSAIFASGFMGELLQTNEEKNKNISNETLPSDEYCGDTSTSSINTEVILDGIQVETGETTNGFLTLTNVTNFGSMSINITWNPAIVNITEILDEDLVLISYINHEEGYANITGFSMSGLDGTITLANITYKGIGAPGQSCPLLISFCALFTADPTPDTISYSLVNGTAEIPSTDLIADAHGPYSGNVNELIPLTGSATGGQPPYTYAWDFDDDGFFDDANGAHPPVIYDTADTYTIHLKVTDDNSDTAIDTTTVEITEPVDFTVEKYVKWNCNGTYLDHISFNINMVDWATFKIYVNTSSALDALSVKDSLPDGLQYLPGYSMVNNTAFEPEINGADLYWNFTNVPAGDSFKITFRVTIPDCTLYENIVSVTGEQDGILTTHTSQATMQVYGCPEPELTIEKYVSREDTGVFSQDLLIDNSTTDWVTYKLVLQTISDFDSISVKDTLDADLSYLPTFSMVNAAPREPEQSGNNLYWNFTSVAAGETIEILFRAHIITCGTFENTVNATGTLDAETIFDTSKATIDVEGCIQPEITVEKTVKCDCSGSFSDSATVDIDEYDWVTFQLEITLTSSFDRLSIRDTLPPGFEYIDDSALVNGSAIEPEVSGQRLFWNLSFVTADTITIQFKATMDSCGEFYNFVNVTASICDEYYYDTDDAEILVDGCDDPFVSIEKYVKWDCTPPYIKNVTAEIGDYVTFKLYINLSDIHDYGTVTIRDTLPDGLTYDTGTTEIHGITVSNEEPSINGKVLSWIFHDVSDEQIIITFCAQVMDCGEHVNTVNLTATICCGDFLYDEDTAVVWVPCEPDIAVKKQASLDGLTWVNDTIETYVGDIVYFRLNVSNTGDSILDGVSVVDHLPDYLHFNDDADPMNGTYPGPGIRWFFPHIEVGSYEIITFSATVVDYGDGYNIVDVSACGGDPTASDQVNVDVSEGIHIEKQVQLENGTWVENLSCMVGDTIRYKIVLSYYHHDANITLFDISIKDILPDGVSYADHATPFEPEVSGKRLFWNFTGPDAYLLSGDQIIIEFNATVAEEGSWRNTVYVTATQCSGTPVNASDTADIDAALGPSVDVIKWVQATNGSWVKKINASIGDIVHFNISICNIGHMPLYGIDVVDVLPEGLAYISDSTVLTYFNETYDCEPGIIDEENNTLIWDNLNFYTGEYLSPHEYLYLTFDATVTGNGTLQNQVNITACRCAQCTLVYDTDTAIVNVSTGGNNVPVIANPQPENNAENVSYENVELSVDVSDENGDRMNVTFYNASDDSVIDTATQVSNGTITVDWDDLTFNTSYTWFVTVSDGTVTISSPTWTFTTGAEIMNHPPAIPSNPSPSNGQSGVSRSAQLRVSVYDEDGDSLNVRFYDASNDQLISATTCTDGDCIASVIWTGLNPDTRYDWYVTVSDDHEQVTSPIWWFRTMLPDVDLDLRILGGFGITAEISNIGTDDATDVSWELDVQSNGLFGRDWSDDGTIARIQGGDDVEALKMSLFGFGRITITVTVDCAEIQSPQTVEEQAILLGGYVILR